MRNLGAVLLFTLCFASPAAAWGDLGHRVVCEIAFRLALPETRGEIRRLLKGDEQYDYYRDSCIYPDHPRQRPSEHFINLSRSAQEIQTASCPVSDKCVLTAIDEDMAVLSSSAADKQKLSSLKFLGHWVGDLHQPLHVSFEDDRGGNSINVSGACANNLHAAWDTCLVLRAIGADPEAAATDLVQGITQVQQELWTQASDPKDWVNESFSITRASTTKYCVEQGGTCSLPSGAVQIDDFYVEKSTPIVKEQLAKAGVRLAHLLNKALQK